MVQFRERTPRDDEEVRKSIADGHQATMWTALPCIISSFNETAITVECVPSIQGTFVQPEDGTQKFVTMPTLVDVPVVYPRGGGYTMTFPIKKGDECLVVFSSRCIDGWWSSGDTSPPTERRMHDLSDGFAIVGPFSQKTKIANVSTTTAQFRSDDSTVMVELDKDGGIATVKAPTQIVLDSPTVLIKASSQVTVQSPAVHASGQIISDGDVTAAHISLDSHTHIGVTSGSGSSGPPAFPR